jgi:MFS transporter, DHA2 family, multidrug resistance protein
MAASGAVHLQRCRAASHKWLIALAVMLGTTLEVLDSSIVNVALPHLQGAFSASLDEIAWVVTSYLVANGIMIPMTGWISARFGRKRYFLTSVFVFVAASVLCGAAQSLVQIVIFRLVQGAAGAAMVPSSQAILVETFPPEERQMAMAVWGMGVMVAPIAGPTIGGWITDNWSWRWNFYINIPIGIAAFLMTSAFVQDPAFMSEERAHGGKVDYAGIGLLVLSLGLLQIVLDRGQRADWFSTPWVVYATSFSALAFVLLVLREVSFGDPILDLRILKQGAFDVATILQVAMSFVLFGTILLSPLFLQELMGYSAWKAGLTLTPRGLAAMFALLLMGQLSRTGINTRPLVGLGFAISSFGCWLTSGWNLEISAWTVIWTGVVMSVGYGLIFPNTSAAALSCVPAHRIGYASSLFNMLRNTGAAIGIALMTNLLLSREQVHQSRLVEHFSIFDAWRLQTSRVHLPDSLAFQYSPRLPGTHQQLGVIYRLLQAQSAMLAFNDIYWIIAIATIPLIPLCFFLPSSKTHGGTTEPLSDNLSYQRRRSGKNFTCENTTEFQSRSQGSWNIKEDRPQQAW